MISTDRLKILNIWIDPLNKEKCLDRVKSFLVSEAGPHVIFASNPEKNFSVPRDPILYKSFKRADLLLPDGIGMVLAARLLYGIKLERVPGVEMMEAICALAAENNIRIFIYGAREEVNKKAVNILQERYPKLIIAGRSHGYINDKDMHILIEKINRSKAEILFIALGSPKQEQWLASYGHLLNTVKVCQGIGGTLDTIAGTVKRAPKIWQKCQIEWLYRLLKEPKRIKRQKVLPIFAVDVLREWMRRRRVDGQR